MHLHSLEQLSKRICLEYSLSVKNKFAGLLYNFVELEQDFSTVEKQKSIDHNQYNFDVISDELLRSYLSANRLNVKLFTEESSWLTIGRSISDLVIICDPFDQSFLSIKTFRGASVGICVFDNSYNFLAAAISDLNTHLIYFADTSSAYAYYPKNNKDNSVHNLARREITTSKVTNLRDAFVVFPAEKQKRMKYFLESKVVRLASRILNIDGLINLGRLASGYIDAFIDPFVGQPIYEIIYVEIAVKAGAVVTDSKGNAFNSSALASNLALNSPDMRYQLVASCTNSLHDELLRNL